MSHELVERFFDVAPIPLGTPAAEVERFLGKATRIAGPEVAPLGFQYDERGLWIATEDGRVTSISFLTGTKPGSPAYPGTLPGGLRVDDPPARVAELYGPADRIQDIPLPKPPGARMSLSFYDLDRADSMVTFAVHNGRPDRLERVVLAGRP